MSVNGDSSTRSPSPSSSESLSDEPANSETVDFSAWCNFSPEPVSESENTHWIAEEQQEMPKIEESSLRLLEEMLNAQNQDISPILPESPMAINPVVFHLSQPSPDVKTPFSSTTFSSFSSDNSSSESALVPDLIPQTVTTAAMPTRVIPPPPVQPRKVDNSMHHRVIFPAKESCYNLAILTPDIPPTGTKSRVETQVRVTLDLALPCGPSGDPHSYDRVGSWKWLKLPQGTATRTRSRKEGKIDASPVDTLYMDTEVTCASNPSKQVLICTTCQGREAKRAARKIAARVRPTRSDSETNDGDNDSSSKIVRFNCPDTLDFSTGSMVLPLRITCYCRHHREKVGFNVHFTMKDASGRLVGKGMSPPIMITDDHKNVNKDTSKQQIAPSYLVDSDWTPHPPPTTPSETYVMNASVSSKRRQSGTKESTVLKRRQKPYDSERTNTRTRRSSPSEATEHPIVDTVMSTFPLAQHEASTMTPFDPFAPSVFASAAGTSANQQRPENYAALPSPSNSNQSPVSPSSSFTDHTDRLMHDVLRQPYTFFPLSPPDTAPSSPPTHDGTSPNVELPSFAYNMLRPPTDPPMSLQAPKIHRLIPSSGPTFGGIEVTVLGSNFHPSVLYNCVFGDVVSSSTTRWSENTLVCILPPRATAGVVPVSLEGLKMDVGGAPALFTYVDETDRSLMELALQVVGLKMTGKVEDAKDIAMRIVGSSQDSQGGAGNTTQMMNLAHNALPDSRRLFLGRGDDAEFERIIIDSLTSLDMRDDSGERESLTSIISHPTKTGQTLLHLAASLNFPSLVEFLIQHDITLDAQDINGYTALHSAILNGSQCCARQVINAGADATVNTKMGYTALELAPEGFFASPRGDNENRTEESDDESNFGDVEEDSGPESRPHSRVHFRRRVRHPRSRRSSRAASAAVSDASDAEDHFDSHAAAEDDDNATVVSPEAAFPMPDSPGKDATLDEKQAASFAEYLQRAWAQITPPHLRPQIPQLPGVPAWVFPVFVPIQAWPPFRKERHNKRNDEKRVMDEDSILPSASWENWMTQMDAEQISGKAGLVADVADVAEVPIAPTPSTSRSILRRFGDSQKHMQVSEKEIQAYSYRPKAKTPVKTVKKEDRMLIVFWLPILILALAWALYASRPVISMASEYIPWGELTNRFRAIA